MNDLLREEAFGDIKIRVYPDHFAEDPRKREGNIGTMVCWHNRVELGDLQVPEEVNSMSDALDYYSINEDTGIYFPIYMYEHSGMTISTKPFSSPWDSGQVGWIFVKHGVYESLDMTWQQAEKALKDEVKVYDAFVRGEIYEVNVVKTSVCKCCGSVNEEVVDMFGGYNAKNVEKLIESYKKQHEMKRVKLVEVNMAGRDHIVDFFYREKDSKLLFMKQKDKLINYGNPLKVIDPEIKKAINIKYKKHKDKPLDYFRNNENILFRKI